MAVVPGDELRGRMTPLEVLAGYSHAPVGLSAGREDDLMVVPPEVGHRDVLTEIHTAVEPEPGIGRDLVEGHGDGLDLLVVGRHAGADEPVRRGEPVDHVD